MLPVILLSLVSEYVYILLFLNSTSSVSYTTCILYSLYPVLPVSYTPCILYSLYPKLPVSYTLCILYSLYPILPVSYTTCILYSLYPILPVSYTPCILFQWGVWAGKTNIILILRKPFTQQTLLDKQTNIFIYYYFSISRLNRTWKCNIKNFSFFP